MELHYDDVDRDVLVIRADGGLNAGTARQLVESIEKLVDAGLRKIIIDCGGLDYVSSFGLGVLVQLHTRMARCGGDVKLAAVKGLIADVLVLTRLNRLLAIYPDIARARLAFRPKSAADAPAAGPPGG